MLPIHNSLGDFSPETNDVVAGASKPSSTAATHSVLRDSYEQTEVGPSGAVNSQTKAPVLALEGQIGQLLENYLGFKLRVLTPHQRATIEKLSSKVGSEAESAPAENIALLREVDRCIESARRAAPVAKLLFNEIVRRAGLEAGDSDTSLVVTILKAYPVVNYPQATLEIDSHDVELQEALSVGRNLLANWEAIVSKLQATDGQGVTREEVTELYSQINKFDEALQPLIEQNRHHVERALTSQAIMQRKEQYRRKRTADVDPHFTAMAMKIEHELRRRLWVIGGDKAVEELDDQLWRIHPAMEVVSSVELGRRLLREPSYNIGGRRDDPQYEEESTQFILRLERDMHGPSPDFSRVQKSMANIAERLLRLSPWATAQEIRESERGMKSRHPIFELVTEMANYGTAHWERIFSDQAQVRDFVTGPVAACIGWLSPDKRAAYTASSSHVLKVLDSNGESIKTAPAVVMLLSELYDEMLIEIGRTIVKANAAGMRAATISHDQNELRTRAYPKVQKWWSENIEGAALSGLVDFKDISGKSGTRTVVAHAILEIVTGKKPQESNLPETLRHDFPELIQLQTKSTHAIELIAQKMARSSGRPLQWARETIKNEILWDMNNPEVAASMYRGKNIDPVKLSRHPHYKWYAENGFSQLCGQIVALSSPINSFSLRHQEIHGDFYQALSARHRNALVRRFLECPTPPSIIATPRLLASVHEQLQQIHGRCHKLAVVSASVALWEQFITSRLGVWADTRLNEHLAQCEQTVADFSDTPSSDEVAAQKLSTALAAIPLDAPRGVYAQAPSYHLQRRDIDEWLQRSGLQDKIVFAEAGPQEVANRLASVAEENFQPILAKIAPQSKVTLKRMALQTETTGKVKAAGEHLRAAYPGTRLAQQAVVNLFIPLPSRVPTASRMATMTALAEEIADIYKQLSVLMAAPKEGARPVSYSRLGRCRDYA